MQFKGVYPTLLIGLFLANCTPRNNSKSDLQYYGTDSQESTFSFSGTVEFVGPRNLSGATLSEEASKTVRRQIKHLFGTLKEHTGSRADGTINFTNSPGVPKTSHQITEFKLVSKVENGANAVYTYSYKFDDKAAFQKDFFKAGKRTLKIRLPKNPNTIYATGLVKEKNLCTDDHYNSEGDYWYFWNPYKKGCPAATLENTILVDATLDPMKNTVSTLPEYDRLNEDGILDITYVVGPDHDKINDADLGRKSFEKTFTILTQGKAVLQSGEPLNSGTEDILAQIPADADVRFEVLEQSRDQRTLYAFRDGKKIIVQMFFLEPTSEAFAFRSSIRDAIMTADILVYDGHSGLGGTLPVSRFFGPEERKFAADKYQVIFFNGCSTFAYYNEQYFKQKITQRDTKGTKNLDIVTTSIGAPWSTGAEIDSLFILSFASGLKPTWQKIMDDVYNVNTGASALTQINGDEDNPVAAH